MRLTVVVVAALSLLSLYHFNAIRNSKMTVTDDSSTTPVAAPSIPTAGADAATKQQKEAGQNQIQLSHTSAINRYPNKYNAV